MKLRLPDSVTSLQDLASMIMELQEYVRWFSHEAIKKQAGAKLKSEPPTLSPMTKDVLESWQAKEPLNRERLDDLIRTLNDYKKTAPTLTITLAAPPTRPVKAAIVGWCRNSLSPDILITFQFNSTLLGGMVVRSGSHVYDWSFRRKILENRYALPEVLRRV